MNKLMRTAASRKGVTMMELVIALAVILLITAAAMSLLFTTTATEGKVARGMAAAEYGESTIECFRYAQDQDEFFEALQLLDEFQEGGSAVDGKEIYVLNKGSYQIEVRAKFTNGGKGTLEYRAYVAEDSEDQDILVLHYEK